MHNVERKINFGQIGIHATCVHVFYCKEMLNNYYLKNVNVRILKRLLGASFPYKVLFQTISTKGLQELLYL